MLSNRAKSFCDMFIDSISCLILSLISIPSVNLSGKMSIFLDFAKLKQSFHLKYHKSIFFQIEIFKF